VLALSDRIVGVARDGRPKGSLGITVQQTEGRRHAGPVNEGAAFLQPAPARDHRKKLVDPRRTAAVEHAAKGVENVASGCFDGARGQIRVAGAANVLGERPGGVVGHRLLPVGSGVSLLPGMVDRSMRGDLDRQRAG
jgi:hypothetical protein